MSITSSLIATEGGRGGSGGGGVGAEGVDLLAFTFFVLVLTTN